MRTDEQKADVVERLKSDAAQLIRMSQSAGFGEELAVRVKSPDLLIGVLGEAATTITALQERIKELEGALRPFADEADAWAEYDDKELLVEDFPGYSGGLLVSDLRAAEATLKDSGNGSEVAR
jgi:hypothetical protein